LMKELKRFGGINLPNSKATRLDKLNFQRRNVIQIQNIMREGRVLFLGPAPCDKAQLGVCLGSRQDMTLVSLPISGSTLLDGLTLSSALTSAAVETSFTKMRL
jgi:hypothetical protein